MYDICSFQSLNNYFTGTLHFANVKKSDVKGEGKFVCNMHNGVYRTSSEGEDKIVNVISSEFSHASI